MRGAFCTTPSPRLQARQWFKHGACMTRLPKTYFNVGSILWRSIRWPDLDRLSRRRDLKAGDIRTAITDANAALKPDMVAIKLDGGGWLEEVRICYGKDFMPRACHPSRRGARDGVKAKIWRGL
jgi:ribonuclease T2